MGKLVACFALLIAPLLCAQESQPSAGPSNNAELTTIYNEDQRIRLPQPLTAEEQQHITRTDVDRLRLVKQMIANNQVLTAEDYRHAALIVQHSLATSDYLLAHTLAVICASQGDKTCVWLSAASLDRYLQSIKQPQIYGTQYSGSVIGKQRSPVTQEPYTPDLITDALRTKLGVPIRDQQHKQLDEMNRQAQQP